MAKFKVVVHAVDGVHTIGTDLSRDQALAEAMEWLGSTYNEVVPELVYVSMYGERLTIQKQNVEELKGAGNERSQ